MAPILHLGMGMIVDTPVELWHGDAWLESVRSTSGEFARIQVPLATEAGQAPISAEQILLPSDCVKFKDTTGRIVYGRVKGIGVDGRALPTGGVRVGKVYSAIINRLVPLEELPATILHTNEEIPGSSSYPLYPSALPELVLIESRDIVPCTDILSQEWVYFTDYESPDDLSTSLLPQQARFCVRRIIYMAGGKVCTRPIHQRHRVMAEGELIYLTREYVLSSLVADTRKSMEPAGGTKITRHVSLPFVTFLDGFGLYRNAYHSLKGMYITSAGLDVDHRTQLANMFVLMMGPFGCSELDMAACLREDSRAVGSGFHTTLESGEPVFVVSFPIMFTGDMPQQNQNSGNKTHNAEFGCRSCFVSDVNRGNLQLDILSTGRYQAPIKRLYNQAMVLPTRTARTVILQKYGLTAEGPYFAECYPMLDPQRANPNDPFHAELRLCKYFSEALLDGILSPSGILAYREAWNDVEVPHRWGQPQNPVSHKGSMVFSEHGRMAIMNPFVLMHLFTNKASRHSRETKKYLKAGVEERVKQSFGREVGELSARLQILRTSYILAKTVHLALKRSLNREEQAMFHSTVIAVRLSPYTRPEVTSIFDAYQILDADSIAYVFQVNYRDEGWVSKVRRRPQHPFGPPLRARCTEFRHHVQRSNHDGGAEAQDI